MTKLERRRPDPHSPLRRQPEPIRTGGEPAQPDVPPPAAASSRREAPPAVPSPPRRKEPAGDTPQPHRSPERRAPAAPAAPAAAPPAEADSLDPAALGRWRWQLGATARKAAAAQRKAEAATADWARLVADAGAAGVPERMIVAAAADAGIDAPLPP